MSNLILPDPEGLLGLENPRKVELKDSRNLLAFNSDFFSTNHLPGFDWHFVWYYLLIWLCFLIIHKCRILFHSVINVCIYIYPVH